MELGEPFKRGMNIQPGEDGTFIVIVLGNTNGLKSNTLGFTTIDDLLIWMAKHGTKSRVTELKEGDVVRNPFDGSLGMGAGAPCGMDALNGLKRTTAAEIIREREARNAAIIEAAAARNGKTLAERIAAAETFIDRVAAAEAGCAGADRPTNDAA